VLRDTIYQLTYKEEVVFVYNASDFKKIRQMPFSGQGWGLTNDGQHIIASNGSNNLYFYEPATFRLVKELPVFENGSPALNINELEYVNGFIYANQWQYSYILKINPSTGEVVARLDLGDLVKRVQNEHKYTDYLNGIAFHPVTKKFYVTGKYWPQIFEIQFDR
jgi:glutamine cyclotransferase